MHGLRPDIKQMAMAFVAMSTIKPDNQRIVEFVTQMEVAAGSTRISNPLVPAAAPRVLEIDAHQQDERIADLMERVLTHVVTKINNRSKVNPPATQETLTRPNKWCVYHDSASHNTEECATLLRLKSRRADTNRSPDAPAHDQPRRYLPRVNAIEDDTTSLDESDD